MPVSVQPVNPGDTKDAGRVKWNTSDENLKNAVNSLEAQQAAHVADGHPTIYYSKAEVDALQATQDAALSTHKTSADHDARYISANTLATIVRTQFEQLIDGVKTFLQNIKIKKATPAIELIHSDGTAIGSYSGEIVSGKTVMRQTIVEAGNNAKIVSEVTEGGAAVNFPNHDVQAKGEKLSTETAMKAYVDNKFINGQVSGSFSITEQIHVANYTSADPIYSTIEGNRKFNGLPECKLIGLHIYRIINGTLHVGESINTLDISLSLSPTQKQTLFVSVARGIDFGGIFKPSLSIMRRTYTINTATDEEVAFSKGGFGNSTVSAGSTDDWFITLIFQIT